MTPWFISLSKLFLLAESELAGWGAITGDTPSPHSLMRNPSWSGTSAGLENIWERRDTRHTLSGKLTDWIFWSRTEKFHPFSSFCPTLQVLPSEFVRPTSTICLCLTFYDVA